MKLLQINTVVNYGSTGRIAENIGKIAIDKNWESYIAYGRKEGNSESKLIKIENKLGNYTHVIKTRITDKHGLGSTKKTKDFINIIKDISPDLIHLHNLHGYYLNYQVLFEYLNSIDTPIIWTLHDCWTFTGHCSHFEFVKCEKWKTECHKCPQLKEYPASFLNDNSKGNFILKKNYFAGNKNLHLVAVSQWLANLLNDSFFKNHPISVINNGIDTSNFNITSSESVIEKYSLQNKFIVLGVTSVWNDRKGLSDLIAISSKLSKDKIMVIVGLNDKQLKKLPKNIVGIKRTNSILELSQLYNCANIFLNPTYEDNFPTTNLEAMACGTPVVTYNTGGSPESITSKTGFIVDQGNITMMIDVIEKVTTMNKTKFKKECRSNVENNYEMNNQFLKYFDLYESILNY